MTLSHLARVYKGGRLEGLHPIKTSPSFFIRGESNGELDKELRLRLCLAKVLENEK